MPSKSKKQRNFLYYKFGSTWVHAHHFDELAPKKRKRKKK